MTPDQYLANILSREAVDTGPFSPVLGVRRDLLPVLNTWGNGFLQSIEPSGSFAKGTANRSGTDIDLFLSLSEETAESLEDIHKTLERALLGAGYVVRKQNVSLNIKVKGVSVDLVPAKRQNAFSDDHSLYQRKANSWTKTNIRKHILYVSCAGRISETRILKLWRAQKALELSSFCLELAVIRALSAKMSGGVAENVLETLRFLRDHFLDASLVDPANTNNVVSDELSRGEKTRIASAAGDALKAANWGDIVK